MKKGFPIGTIRPELYRNWCGYLYQKVKTATGWKSVFEHRIIWEKHFGPIPPGCFLHHKNGIKTDNRIENLHLVKSNSEHHKMFHHEQRVRLGRKVGLWNKGRPKSIEWKEKISLIHKGKPKSPEHRLKLSMALRGRKRPDISLRLGGRKLAKEHRAKIIRVWKMLKRDSITGRFLGLQ